MRCPMEQVIKTNGGHCPAIGPKYLNYLLIHYENCDTDQ